MKNPNFLFYFTVADNLDLEKICNFEGSLKDFKVLPAPNESFETHKTNIDRVKFSRISFLHKIATKLKKKNTPLFTTLSNP